MRAGPVVPVELAWRWGRNSRHKLAEAHRRLTGVHQARGQHAKNFLALSYYTKVVTIMCGGVKRSRKA